MPTPDELIALFGDDFGDVLEGLNALPVEVRQLLDGTMGKMVHDAEIFSQRVNQAVTTQRASGISSAVTTGVLAGDMIAEGAIFGEIRNSIKESLVEGINQAGRAGQYQAYDADDKTIFIWVTVAGHKICADCNTNTGEQGTLKEWDERGAPGTGWSVCGGHCYCILDPSGKISPLVEAEKGRAELIQKGKPLEQKYKWEYNVKKDHRSAYDRFMKLDSSTAREMMKPRFKDGKMVRGQLTRAQIIRQTNDARKKLSVSKQSIDPYVLRNKFGDIIPKKVNKVRTKLHDDIVNEIVSKGKIAKKGQQELLTTGGYPGSGKSTMLDQAFPGWEKKFVHLDADRIKELLAKADGVELKWRAALYHQESKIIVNKIRKLAMEQNRHILYDATMKSTNKFVKAIEAYKSRGYKVTAAFADLPIEQAMERAIARFFGSSGRFVDPLYISTHGNQNIATFNELKRIINAWTQYSTNVPIKTPALFMDGFP